jgi:hypothetical protein
MYFVLNTFLSRIGVSGVVSLAEKETTHPFNGIVILASVVMLL